MSESLREVSYLCSRCKHTRRLTIDQDLHLQRRELGINGLATYIDIHGDEKNPPHGVKLSIDPNFHVRTNTEIKVKAKGTTPGPAIPIPGMKIKQLNTRHMWRSWVRLELETKGRNVKFILENPNTDLQVFKEETYATPINTVSCKVQHAVDPFIGSEKLMENCGKWIEAFIKYLELAPDLHVDLIPEILQYIDNRANFPPTSTDERILSVLMDRSAILIPYKDSLKRIARYGPAIHIPGIDSQLMADIAGELAKLDELKMSEIQDKLKKFMLEGEELEEEVIVTSLAYLLLFDQFETKLSYLN